MDGPSLQMLVAHLSGCKLLAEISNCHHAAEMSNQKSQFDRTSTLLLTDIRLWPGWNGKRGPVQPLIFVGLSIKEGPKGPKKIQATLFLSQ